MMLDLLIVLVLAHLVADFVLQSNETCQLKCHSVGKQRVSVHLKHAAIYLAVNMALVGATGNMSLLVLAGLAALTSAHGLLDLGKSYINGRFAKYSLLLLVADQFLHLCTVFALVWYFFPSEF